MALFPNATHIIQPCDVAIFRALKIQWKKAVQCYKQETEKSITKATFAPVFEKAFNELKPEAAINGFKKCGLYPFNSNAVDYNKCISTRRKEINNTESIAVDSCDLAYKDYLSANKFLNSSIDKKKLSEFIDIRNENKLCTDPLYVLWAKSVDYLESYEEDVDIDKNVPEISSVEEINEFVNELRR